MSDGGKTTKDNLSQDLEHTASTVVKTESPFSEKELQAKDAQVSSEYDRSLANIHTGSQEGYEAGAAMPDAEAMTAEQAMLVETDVSNEENLAGETVTFDRPDSRLSSDQVISDTGKSDVAHQAGAAFESFSQETEALLGDTDTGSPVEEASEDRTGEVSPVATNSEETLPVTSEMTENTAPQSVELDDNNIDENSAVGTVVGTVSAEDLEGDTLTYALSDDAGGMFTIDPATGEIKVAGALDHEGTDSYSVTVDVSDGEHITQQTFTINVGDVNEAAHSVALDDNSVDENSALGTVVGTVTAEDPEGDTLTYALSDDAGGMFTIDPSTGEIKVAGALDHEATDRYSVTVDVSDGEHITQQTFTINVGDVNEAAHSVALDDNSVDENSAVGTVVGTVTAEDPEGDTLSYSLSDDAGGMFTIDPSTGEIKVAGALDYESADSYSVTVDVDDGTNVTQQNLTIDVGDLAAPSLIGGGNTIDASEIEDVVDLSHMDQFPELYAGSHLENRVGTEVFDDMVEDAQKLVINYQSEATVTFQGETAGYQNSVGAYQIKEDGTIEDVQLLWGDASTDKLTIGESTATYTGIEQGSELGFFIISNGFGDLPSDAVSGDGNTISETGTWMFVSPDFDPANQNPEDHQYNVNTDTGAPQMIYVEGDGTIHTQSGNVFHSLRQEEFNPDSDVDSREHFVAGVDAENGILNFGIEDLMGGGDADFDDSMFSVEIDARDLVEAPNPLFAESENGQSTFQISDADSGNLSELVVTLSDAQAGDTLSVGGAYDLVGGEVFLPDGTSTGIAVTIVEDGSTITMTLSGTGSAQDYEGIVQKLNFSNDSGEPDVSGFRTVSVVATDDSGESSDTLVTSLYVDPDGGGPDTGATIAGTSGNDVFVGSSGDDQISGGDGSDMFYFGAGSGDDTFIGGDGGGWSDTIVLSDGLPSGDINDWLSLDTGTVESTADGEVFLSEDASGTITVDGVELTFEGVEKIEG